MSEIKIERLTRATKEEYKDIKALLPQLSSGADLEEEELARVLENKNANVFVARDGKKIVGIGLLVIMPVLVEQRGRIEDVVVDESCRGKGVGRELMEMLLLAARGKGLAAIELSSGPQREAANALYKKLGFEEKETNVYRLEL